MIPYYDWYKMYNDKENEPAKYQSLSFDGIKA